MPFQPSDIVKITVVSDDSLGLQTKALNVSVSNGTLTSLANPTEIKEFVGMLSKSMPAIAISIRDELASKDRPINYEAILFSRK